MKKIIAVILALLIACTTLAFANGEPFANAGELYQNRDSEITLTAAEARPIEESAPRGELPAPRVPVSTIIAIILIVIGVAAIIASIIILRKKRARR